jgi:hypothetical protein
MMSAAIAVFIAVGCTTVTPRENFETFKNTEIGRHVSELIPGAQLGIKTRTLDNGNVEYTYDFSNRRGPCVYVREVDAKTNRIVAWRIEGDDSGCQIAP